MFKTITTLQVAEAEEAIFDASGARLLEQRLREANAAFEAGKRDLAMVLAEEAGERRLAAEIGYRLAEDEAAAIAALDAGKDGEAERLAERIAGLGDDLKAYELAASDCADAARRIRVRQSEQHDFVEAMDRVEGDPSLKAPGASSFPRVGVTDPKDVLNRLKVRRGGADRRNRHGG